eukprot:6189319-Pleurochrysis_carterae.AAC.1
MFRCHGRFLTFARRLPVLVTAGLFRRTGRMDLFATANSISQTALQVQLPGPVQKANNYHWQEATLIPPPSSRAKGWCDLSWYHATRQCLSPPLLL